MEQKGPPPKRSKQEEEKERHLRVSVGSRRKGRTAVTVCVPVLCLQEQGELVWKFRDQLQAILSTAELKQLLQANSQTVPSGESSVRCWGKVGASAALTWSMFCHRSWTAVLMGWCLVLSSPAQSVEVN